MRSNKYRQPLYRIQMGDPEWRWKSALSSLSPWGMLGSTMLSPASEATPARYMASDDPDFEAKAADVIGLYLEPPKHAAGCRAPRSRPRPAP